MDNADNGKYEWKPCGSKLSVNDVDMRDYQQQPPADGGPKCNSDSSLPPLAIGPYQDPKPLDGVLRWPRPVKPS